MYHNDPVGLKSQVAKKRKKITEGKSVNVTPVTRIMHALTNDGARSPLVKMSMNDFEKTPIDMDVIL